MKYTAKDLPTILQGMADYTQGCIYNGEDVTGYFEELIKTGLFHDSEGKVMSYENGTIDVAIEF